MIIDTTSDKICAAISITWADAHGADRDYDAYRIWGNIWYQLIGMRALIVYSAHYIFGDDYAELESDIDLLMKIAIEHELSSINNQDI